MVCIRFAPLAAPVFAARICFMAIVLLRSRDPSAITESAKIAFNESRRNLEDEQ